MADTIVVNAKMGVVLTKNGRGPKIFARALHAAIILPQLRFNPSYTLDFTFVHLLIYGYLIIYKMGEGAYT